jgi:hypothetical protein
LVLLGNVFVDWAETPNSNGHEIVEKLGPALEAAAEANPDDWRTHYWKGVSQWTKRRVPEDEERAFASFGEALTQLVKGFTGQEIGRLPKLKALLDRVQVVIGDSNRKGLLEVLNHAIPSNRKNLQPTHVHLLYRRCELIAPNPELSKKDLQREEPKCLLDVEDLVRLNPQHSEQVKFYSLAVAALKDNDKARVKYIEKMADLLLQDDTYGDKIFDAAGWPQGIAQYYRRANNEQKAAALEKMAHKHAR